MQGPHTQEFEKGWAGQLVGGTQQSKDGEKGSPSSWTPGWYPLMPGCNRCYRVVAGLSPRSLDGELQG